MPRRRLSGCACSSPLAHFYIYHSDSSLRELHPFTTITHLASEKHRTNIHEGGIAIQFLFRKRSRPLHVVDLDMSEKKSLAVTLRTLMSPKKKQTIQWTEKLASVAEPSPKASTLSPAQFSSPSSASVESSEHEQQHPLVAVSLRLEGPYFTPAEPSRYHTVICLAAGTGITGSIAIAKAFFEVERQRASSESCCNANAPCTTSSNSSVWKRCVVVWSVREADYFELPFLQGMRNEH